MPKPLISRPTPSYDLLQASQPSSSSYQQPGQTAAAAAIPQPTPPPISTENRVEAVFIGPKGLLKRDAWRPPSVSYRKGKRRAEEEDVEMEDIEGPHIRKRRDIPLAKRRLEEDPSTLVRRAVAYPSCNNEGNDVLACYPTSNTTIYQDQWTKFIWNARLPEFIGIPGAVDIYLYHEDSGQLVEKWADIPNVQGEIDVVANDTFWDYRMDLWQPGEAIAYTYYFVIVKSGTNLTGGESRLATWTAVQTALADSVYASETSASSIASASSLAYASALSALGPTSLSMLSVSSQSLASVAARETGVGGAGALQGNGGSYGGNSFPGWGIALLVVLGVLALVSLAALVFLLIQHYRNRRRRRSTFSHRESMGSSSPMMQQVGSEPPFSPVGGANSPPANYGARPGSENLGLGVAAGLAGAAAKGGGGLRHHSSLVGGDASSVSDSGPISVQDAAIMADAFRLALRKPDFADRPVEEGESPDTSNRKSESKGTPSTTADPGRPLMPPRNLTEEGSNLRNVGSARGVTVQYPSDDSGQPSPDEHPKR